MSKRRTTLPLVLSTVTGMTAATLMFALPGDAAPTPSTFSAEARGEVWRVNKLDLTLADSNGPSDVQLTIAGVAGLTGQAASPDRSMGRARDVDAPTAPAGQVSLISTATSSKDTAGTATASGPAGTLQQVLDHDTAVLTARGRWGGDTTCLDASAPLTQSKVLSRGAGIVPTTIPSGTPGLPIPIPTALPTEIPTTPPTDFPTELPTDLPSPTLPTEIPTTIIPTTIIPTSIIPTSIIPTSILPIRSDASAARADGDVSLMQVAAAAVEQKTFLQALSGSTTVRRVYAETTATIAAPDQPVAQFFGGEATLSMTGAPKLSAYSTGGGNGSQVDWAPAPMVLTVNGEPYPVPTDGTALALPYSDNEDVVLTISAGKLSSAEKEDGTLSQASVSALNVVIKNGTELVLDAELFPMSVKTVSPVGGVDCTPAPVPPRQDPGLVLKGKNNGAKPDRLVVLAKSIAAGAKATVFKKVGTGLKKIDAKVLDNRGDRTFKIKDKNGKKRTTYVVKLAKTSDTKAAQAKRRIR